MTAENGDSEIVRPTTTTTAVGDDGRVTEPNGRSTDRVTARERFGGVKIGAAFFGWLTATGVAVLLLALAAGSGLALGLTNGIDPQAVSGEDLAGIGIAGAAVLAVIVFVAYFAGGYVAGRMARFDGARQGFAVWLWGLVIGIVLAALAAVAGTDYDVLGRLSLPRIPVDEGTITTAGLLSVVVALLVALAAAVLGGLTGMRYHRRVDSFAD